MKPNINDVSSLQDLKRVLAEKNVSASTISTLEKALKKGMSFRRVEDLSLLNIATVDLGVVRESVDFGASTPAGSNLKTVEYRFKPIGPEKAFYGYQLIVRTVDVNGFTLEEAFPIEDDRVVIVDYDLSTLKADSVVTLHANTATGERTKIKIQGAGTASEFLEIPVAKLGNAVIEVTVVALSQTQNPDLYASYPVKGRLISNKADANLEGYQIVLFAATGNAPDFVPVAVAHTETNGYFVTGPLLFDDPADLVRVTAAKAGISKGTFSTEQLIRLVAQSGGGEGSPSKSMIPERVILVVNEGAGTGDAAAGDDCGCGDLNFHEKKVLEEYSYYTVVRTSEPSIIADVIEDEQDVDLQDIYGVPGVVPLSVFRKFHQIESKQIKVANFAMAPAVGAVGVSAEVFMRPAAGTAVATTGVKAPPFNRDLLDKLLIDHKVGIVIKGNAKPVFKGRTHLNQTHQIDWDDTPTIYQAASIAHGHLLQFKQEWIPDGYSIGDIVYSLPLAPGQKKQIAVLDWERRESAANTQALDYEETLNASLVRDRDINEIVSGTLTENIRGNSKASTGGIGFGLGSSVMGIIPGVGTFGSLLGISGGKSTSSSNASQSSYRESTANSLQRLSDRTQQAASVVRSQRATVVQTVSQGERVQATAESVANYNHCHAITIQYFEVLRHFKVRNRLAGVQECLFVPLQISQFDLEKCLRWRTSLEKHLFRRELLPAFAAVARIQQEKESPFENYYDSIGYPRKNFAEQAVKVFTGELFFEFFFFNTNERKVDDAIVAFYSFFGISLDGYRDKQITDEELAKHVGPRAIEYLLDAFTIETDGGADLKLDLTLLSTFRQSASLRVSVRQAPGTPQTIAREQIGAINVKLDLSKLPDDQAQNLRDFQNKYLKVRLRSGNLRYRTDNFAGTLFEGRIENDIFPGGDGAYIPTPLTREELRNPRGEDVSAANNLIQHLNENLEYYNNCLLFDMTPERRFMLLDGILAPGKAEGRSVASVVENRVIGIAGNSLVMPVAPGYQLDPTIDEKFDLFAQYYGDEPEPMRVSIPTKGVYAESVMGKCNACEEKDESRFWRWEESPIPDSPNTQILPLNTDTRRADPGNLQPKDFPSPVVNIQNAPSAPDPTGLQNLLTLLGKGDAFRDLAGLNQNQLNALATFQKTMDTAQSFGKEAAELAKTMATVQMAKDAQKNGALSNDDTKEIVKEQLKKPEPEKEREESKKDVQQIEDLREKEELDDDQSKEMKEDRIRKGQGTTKPAPSKKRPSGKKKFNLTLLFKSSEGLPNEGTWVVTIGNLVAETFDIDNSTTVKRLSVELDTSMQNILEIRGNPYIMNTSSPTTSQYYYFFGDKPVTIGSSPNLTFTIVRTRSRIKFSTEKSKSRSVAIEDGLTRQLRIMSAPTAEVDLLIAKFGGTIEIEGTRTWIDSTVTEEGETATEMQEYEMLMPARRIKVDQEGVDDPEVDVEE